MILYILAGLALLVLLVTLYRWGHAQGELDEFKRTRPFDWKE